MNTSAVQVFWQNAEGATHFQIHLDSNHSYANISENITCPHSTNCSYVIDKLTPGSGHNIAILASSGGVQKSVSCSLYGAAMPSVPTCVQATSLNTSAVQVFWQNAEGATHFQIQLDSNHSYANISENIACPHSINCSYVIGKLTPGSGHNIAILASSGGVQNSVSCSLYGVAMPSEPKCVGVTSLNTSAVQVFWENAEGATHFQIQLDSNHSYANISENIACPQSTKCSYVIDKLTPGSGHDVAILASSGGVQNSVSFSLHAVAMPSVPKCVQATSLNTSAVQVFWQNAEGATHFQIQLDSNLSYANISENIACPHSANCSYVIDKLTPGSGHNIAILASSGGVQNSVSCSLYGAAMPSVPKCVQVTSLNTSTVQVFWQNAEGATHFQIHLDSNHSYANISENIACPHSINCSYVIGKLTPGSGHNIAILASSGGVQNSVSCSLYGVAVLSEPKCVGVTSLNTSAVQVFWENAEIATHFQIHLDSNHSYANISENIACPYSINCSYVIDKLTPGSGHDVAILASSGGVQNSVSCSLHAVAMPSVPKCVQVTSLNTSAVQVFWQNAEGATHFQIQLDSNLSYANISENIACPHSANCSYVIDKLTPGSGHNIAILASSGGVQNSVSCSLYGAAMPSVPKCVQVTSLNTSTVQVFWQNAEGATHFQIHLDSNHSYANISENIACPHSINCSYVIGKLTPGSGHNIAILASSGGVQNSVSCSLYGVAVLSEPKCVGVTSLNTSAVQVFWENAEIATHFQIHLDSNHSYANISENIACPYSINCSYVIDKLTPGSGHDVAILASSGGVQNSVSCSLHAVAMPSVPKCVQATSLNTSAVQVFWQNAEGATHFQIQLDSNLSYANTSENIACPHSANCSYVIDKLTPGSGHNIAILASSGGVQNSVSCSLYGEAMPSVPKCVQVTSLNTSAVQVFWQNAEGATHFQIHLDSNHSYANISENIACPHSINCSYVIGKLTPGSGHNIAILASSGGVQNSVSCSLYGVAVPSEPKCVGVTSLNTSAVQVFWENAEIATHFQIHLDSNHSYANISENIACPYSINCSYVIDKLTPGSGHDVAILASSGGVQNSVSCSLHAVAMPSVPKCVQATSLNTSAVQVFWQNAEGATHFQIQLDSNLLYANISENIACPHSANCSYVIDKLTPGSGHNIAILASSGGVQNSVSCSLYGAAMPSVPKCVQVTSLNTSAVQVFWQNAEGATHFQIHLDSNHSYANISENIACPHSINCSYVIGKLTPGSGHNIAILASSGGVQNSVSCSLYGVAVPSEPKCVGVTSLNTSAVQVFWENAEGATHFQIHLDSNHSYANISENIACPHSTNCSYVIDKLTPGSGHKIAILASSGGVQNSVSCSLYGVTLPSVPKCVQVTTINTSAVQVFWQNAEGATHFQIQLDSNHSYANISENIACPNSINCSYVIGKLTPGSSHAIAILASSGGVQNTVSCSLYGVAMPSVPKCVEVTSVNTSTVQIFWQNAEGATHFQIQLDSNLSYANISKTVACPHLVQCSYVINKLIPGSEHNISILASSGGVQNSVSCSLYGVAISDIRYLLIRTSQIFKDGNNL
ncbi:hypothetical protein CHS0354_007419 [Potamilus streckersoni]|uniref:Fibronectin type-III domain-containing protein n=1 Tax=Potamilus streckersoni TaxID=2493646 RepID=A0AAE0W297_9BIVA|nr:hypothetical protein CHS0354_007419 [Potamilus streckersoni]